MPVSTGAPCAPPGQILWSLSIALRSSAIVCASGAGGFVSLATCTSCLSGGFFPGGFAPPDPPTRSLAGAPTPRSARVAHSLRSLRFLSGGLRPAGPPARSLAGAPSPAPLAWLTRCARSRFWSGRLRPAGPPHARSRGPRRPAPLAWLTRFARSPGRPEAPSAPGAHSLLSRGPRSPLRSRGSLANRDPVHSRCVMMAST